MRSRSPAHNGLGETHINEIHWSGTRLRWVVIHYNPQIRHKKTLLHVKLSHSSDCQHLPTMVWFF